MSENQDFIMNLIKKNNYKLCASGLDDVGIIDWILNYLKKYTKKGTKVISVIGGAASGKTAFTRKLVKNSESADLIGTDDYLIKDIKFRRKYLEGGNPRKKYDQLLLNIKVKEITKLKLGDIVKVPTYNQNTGIAIAEGKKNYKHKIGKVNLLFVEGDFDFVDRYDCKIFYNVPCEIRRHNRIKRDHEERSAKDINEIIKNFNLRQKKQHIPYVLPAAKNSDLIIIVKPLKNKKGYKYKYSIYNKNVKERQ